MSIYFGFFAVVLGTTLCVLFFISKSAKWPTVPGEVVSASYDTVTTYGDTHRLDFKLDLKYKYQVDGREYIGDRILKGVANVYSTTTALEQALATYTSGSHVEVYYNPDNPQYSALETLQINDKGSPMLVLGGLIVIAVGIFASVIFLMTKF